MNLYDQHSIKPSFYSQGSNFLNEQTVSRDSYCDTIPRQFYSNDSGSDSTVSCPGMSTISPRQYQHSTNTSSSYANYFPNYSKSPPFRESMYGGLEDTSSLPFLQRGDYPCIRTNHFKSTMKITDPFSHRVPLPHEIMEHFDCKQSFIRRRNERERERVRCVNQGYDTLRKCLPLPARDKRISKVEILRAAIRYISSLQGILDGNIVDNQSQRQRTHDRIEISATSSDIKSSSSLMVKAENYS